jgi:hypothetical protein
MTKIFVCLLSGIFAASHVLAQEKVDLKSFAVPTTPAFTILNLGPQSVTRPTTTKGVVACLLQGVDGNQLNPNVSLEFAPYWLKNRHLSFRDYFGFNMATGTFSPRSTSSTFKENLAISVATTKTGDNKEELSGTRLGWGIRTKIMDGVLSQDDQNSFREHLQNINLKNLIRRAVKNMTTTGTEDEAALRSQFQVQVEGLLALPGGFPQDLGEKATTWFDNKVTELFKAGGVSEFLSKVLELASDNSIDALAIQNLKESTLQRIGLICEVGIAGSQYFTENTVDKSVFNKLGVWGTLTYRLPDKTNEFIGILRYTLSDGDSLTTNGDIGISLNRIEDENFYWGFELLGRYLSYKYNTIDFKGDQIRAIDSKFTYRFSIKGAYKLTSETEVNFALGKDFDSPIQSSGNLLALLGLNFSLPTKQTVTP